MCLTGKKKWVWLTLRVALHVDFWRASEDGASCQQRYSSVIRRRVTVASSMFTLRAGAGSAEARRAGANGVWIEARRAGAEAQIEGQSRECGGSIGDSTLSFYGTCIVPELAPSAVCAVPPSIPISRIFL